MNLRRILPPMGNRLIKTAIAVFICLIAHILTGFKGSASTSVIAAILCMQPFATDTKSFALERVLGTLFGVFWGVVYLVLMHYLPYGDNIYIAYSVMAVFVLLSMYTTVVIKKASAAALIAIVFLGMVVDNPYSEISIRYMLETILSTLFGVLVAVAVNVTHAPRKKHPEYLFFVRTMDLVPDRYRHIPSSVHYALDYLYNDGAKICLISRWAPAFIISQMGVLNVNSPAIVMDGAALYDISENKYLDVIEIPKENAKRLCGIINSFGSFCSFYTVQNRTLCIYRDGPISDAERAEYDKLKRSPYRNYMEGTYTGEDRIAFIRVIDTPERIEQLKYEIQSVLPPGMFRMEMREEAQFKNYMGLYFYDSAATVQEMKQRVMKYLQEKNGTVLKPRDMLPKLSKYRPEQDALLLLSRVKNKYEPISLSALFKKKDK